LFFLSSPASPTETTIGKCTTRIHAHTRPFFGQCIHGSLNHVQQLPFCSLPFCGTKGNSTCHDASNYPPSLPSLSPILPSLLSPSLSHLISSQLLLKIFGTWQRDLPLLSLTMRGDMQQIAQANLRVVSRILVKLSYFPHCYDALQKLKVVFVLFFVVCGLCLVCGLE
jgi:hypothetical protein